MRKYYHSSFGVALVLFCALCVTQCSKDDTLAPFIEEPLVLDENCWLEQPDTTRIINFLSDTTLWWRQGRVKHNYSYRITNDTLFMHAVGKGLRSYKIMFSGSDAFTLYGLRYEGSDVYPAIPDVTLFVRYKED